MKISEPLDLRSALDLLELGKWESVIDQFDWPPDPASTDGEKLLAWGIVTSQKGAAEQSKDAQNMARDLLTRAIQFLDGEDAELARIHLSLCYYRKGNLRQSFALLNERFLTTRGKFCGLLTQAIIKLEEHFPLESLQLLDRIEGLSSHVSEASQGKYHNHRALALRRLAANNSELRDLAIAEFTAADYFFERCDAPKLRGIANNNLARLYSLIRESRLAHEHVDRAISFAGNDKGLLAQFLDQKARIYLDEGDCQSAKIACEKALSLLSTGEQGGVIKECVDTLIRCVPGAVPYSLQQRSPMLSSRTIELAGALVTNNDGENVNQLIELIAAVSDPSKSDPVLRYLYTRTDHFQHSYADFMVRFTPTEASEDVLVPDESVAS